MTQLVEILFSLVSYLYYSKYIDSFSCYRPKCYPCKQQSKLGGYFQTFPLLTIFFLTYNTGRTNNLLIN